MRIAILTELFYPHVGGTEVRLYEMSKKLVRRGHEVDVFTIQHSPNASQEEDLEAIHVKRYAYSPKYVTASGFRSWSGVVRYSLSTVLKTLGTDYDIYYFGQWPLLHAVLTKPFVSRCVQEWCEVWYEKIVALERILSRVMDNHVAVSEFTKRRMVDFLHLDPNHVTIIPNGVDLQKYRDGVSKSWGKMVYVGRVTPHKGLNLLLDAFRMIKDKAPDVELYIAGSGSHLPILREYAKGLDGVYMLGDISEAEKIKLLKSSWLFMMPSSREGSSIAILEAMAAGTPVLTIDHPDNAAKYVCNMGNGVITNPDSVDIASAALELLSDENEWDSMRRSSLKYVEQFDWNIIASQLERYLKWIVKNN
jgi:glycosyltransferase involved in cell wall biosynthesis